MGPARWSKASPMLFLAAVDRLGLGCYATVYAMCNIAYPIGMMATNALASVVAAELGFMDTPSCAALSLPVCTPFFLQKETTKAAVH